MADPSTNTTSMEADSVAVWNANAKVFVNVLDLFKSNMVEHDVVNVPNHRSGPPIGNAMDRFFGFLVKTYSMFHASVRWSFLCDALDLPWHRRKNKRN